MWSVKSNQRHGVFFELKLLRQHRPSTIWTFKKYVLGSQSCPPFYTLLLPPPYQPLCFTIFRTGFYPPPFQASSSLGYFAFVCILLVCLSVAVQTTSQITRFSLFYKLSQRQDKRTLQRSMMSCFLFMGRKKKIKKRSMLSLLGDELGCLSPQISSWLFLRLWFYIC